MSSQTSTSTHPWTYTAISVVAGLGAGYLIGLISAKFVWVRKNPPRLRPTPLTRDTQTQGDDPSLIEAVNALSVEVGRLRVMMEAKESSSSRHGMKPVDSYSDFVSAQEGSVNSTEDEFFDITTTKSNTGDSSPAPISFTTQNTPEDNFDELGKTTQESEEVCTNLIEQLQSGLEESPNNIGMLWRISRATMHLSMHKQKEGKTVEEQQLLTQAAEYSKQGIEIDPSCWQAHQWYACAIGTLSKFRGTQQKIQQGHEYKEHIDTAISLNPESPTLHYLCGRWCFEVAGLSWLEKKAAAALFATPPNATYDEALQCFMHAEDRNPGKWKGNMLMIAKCHIRLHDASTSLAWLNMGYNLPTITPDDKTSHTEIEELLVEYDDAFNGIADHTN